MKVFVVDPSVVTEHDGSARAEIVGEEFHYLAHVRRLRLGGRLDVLTGGARTQATIVALDAARLTLEWAQSSPSTPSEPSLGIHLIVGLLKGRKLDDVVRQAAELGATSVQPVQSDHCVARWNDEKPTVKLQRWQAIAKEAAQQSGATSILEIRNAEPLEKAVEIWAARGPLLFFHQVPLAKASLHGYLSCRPTQVAILIGPEGGLSDRETTYLTHQGALPVWFGPSVFRAETACVAALAAVKLLLLETSEWITPI